MLIKNYTDNPSKIVDHKLYLDSGIIKVYYGDGYYAYKISAYSYVKESIRNVNKHMK